MNIIIIYIKLSKEHNKFYGIITTKINYLRPISKMIISKDSSLNIVQTIIKLF